MPKQIINIGTSPNDGTGDPLRTGGQKINQNFTEVYGFLNNRVTATHIPIDWTSATHPLQQIADWVNTNGLTIARDEIKWIISHKITPLGSLEQVFYMWLLGAGDWGAFGVDVGIECAGRISIVAYSDSEINKYDLGEIGTTLISDAVNGSGPYGVTTQQPVYFVVERSGNENVYLYIGNVEGEVGLGEAQTDESDFVNLTEEPIPPIDPNDFVTNEAFNGSLYDTAETGFSTDLSNFNSLTEKFYFLRISGEGDTVYFASKDDNVEDFVGSRIYISATGTKHDLGSPTVTQNGYNFWDIGVLPVTINPSTEEWDFQAWFHVGQIPKEIPIDGSKFRLVKGVTGGSLNTGSGIEINDIAEGGIYDHPIVGAKVLGSLKCIDNTGDLTTGIGTKWEPFGSFTPA